MAGGRRQEGIPMHVHSTVATTLDPAKPKNLIMCRTVLLIIDFFSQHPFLALIIDMQQPVKRLARRSRPSRKRAI